MYSVTEIEDGRILLKLPTCRKIFTSDGELVKFGKSGMVKLPKDSRIAVCKILPFMFHTIRMTKSFQLSHHNAVIEKERLGEKLEINEEEILLASLEVLEVL